MRLLLVEDDPVVVDSLVFSLSTEGFDVEAVGTAAEALELASLYEYDAVLMDLGLPGMGGLETIKALRRSGDATPIMVVTGELRTDAKVSALDAGADDYVTKPYDPQELIARIRALARRARGHAQPEVRIGELCVNLSARTVEAAGREVWLTGKEYAVLEILCLRKGQVVSRETVLNHLYGGLDEPDSRVVDVLVCRLRRKLAQACGGESHIHTCWGRGFMLREVPPLAQAA